MRLSPSTIRQPDARWISVYSVALVFVGLLGGPRWGGRAIGWIAGFVGVAALAQDGVVPSVLGRRQARRRVEVTGE